MLGLFTFGRGQKRGIDDVEDIISVVAGYVSIPFVTSHRFDAEKSYFKRYWRVLVFF